VVAERRRRVRLEGAVAGSEVVFSPASRALRSGRVAVRWSVASHSRYDDGAQLWKSRRLMADV